MNTAPWRLELTRTAQRDLRRLDAQVRQASTTHFKFSPRIRTRARAFAGSPGAPRRLVLRPAARVIVVMRILPRGRAYRD